MRSAVVKRCGTGFTEVVALSTQQAREQFGSSGPHQSIDTDNFARVDVKGDVVDHRIASGIDAGNMFRFENRRAERAAWLKKITHRVAAQHFTHNPRHIDIANSGFGLEFAIA